MTFAIEFMGLSAPFKVVTSNLGIAALIQEATMTFLNHIPTNLYYCYLQHDSYFQKILLSMVILIRCLKKDLMLLAPYISLPCIQN